MQIHEGDDQKNLEAYWSRITKIPKSRFTKTIIRPKGRKVGKAKGTCKIRYSDKNTYIKLNNLLKDVFSLAEKRFLSRNFHTERGLV